MLAAAPSGAVVGFPDPQLEEAVRRALGKAQGAITVADMRGLETLVGRTVRPDRAAEASEDRVIDDLTGLEHAVNLRELDLKGNHVRDLSPLRKLRRLETVVLSYNQMFDVRPL